MEYFFDTMQSDSLSSSHPISTEVNNPTEIGESFDDITYIKVLFKVEKLNLRI